MRSISASSRATSASVTRACLRMHVLRQGGQNRAQIEELVLHAQQDGAQRAKRGGSAISATVARATPRKAFSSSTAP